ncbi:DUF177 domain-containing protein [Mesobaculum littorinae]|uniref:DUF177 domain-containing protein n=1 Tax=Mesobaculum littorinae TaxID=2486419 RepID=A0A438AJQ0_9RHOB|nr:YceD family protein [Mesobaculum littorinae]RVV98912.1 DUF177 domain-containing protein [Mesobaculum littorinae]
MPSDSFRDPVRLTGAGQRQERDILIEPGPEIRAAIAEELDLLGLRKLRLEGRLMPEGRADWRFEGRLGATVVQPCSVTLAPVTTRIDEPVTRRWVEDMPRVDLGAGAEVEMPEDDTLEPLAATADLGRVTVEALSLALPAFPRAPDADFDVAQAAPPGTDPVTDAEVRPFAGLQALRDRMKDEE